jgi:predicted phosphoadenosine phosphosulfate sulfurtransferase
MYDMYWRPWEESKKDIWVSDLPVECYTKEDFDFYKDDMWDYEFQEKFSQWYHEKKGAKRTAALVGIRTQESLNRWRAIHSDRNYKKYKSYNWTKRMYPNVYNAYPVYDWITTDVWAANGKFNWSYNKLYDVFYQAGLTIDQMRVASPFLSTAQSTLKLYRVIEPATWGKLIGRVNGVNFTGIYGGTTAMGWKELKLPQGHTWKTYMEFLLSTLPETTADNYKKKLETSVKFWRTRGGVLSNDVIQKLQDLNIPITVGESTNYKTDKRPVTMEYLDDIDIVEFTDIPTYKRMCICIIKNDHLCKYMGFSLTKNETELRKKAETKYKNL